MKFDVSGLTGTVSRAVLWVYGNVQDSGGSTTTRQAFAAGSDTSHLGNVQTKLAARNRVEIAAWAWETGLVDQQ